MPSHYYNYLPFGEVSVSQNTTNYNNVYRFSAKELDEETQLSYFGARYYDARLSYWLSVDPLAEKFPSWNAYNYCFQNPIKFIDPDGRDPIDYVNSDGNKIGTDGTNLPGTLMITDNQDVKNIENAEKSGNHIKLDQLRTLSIDMIMPSDNELKESLNVLQRMKANGGLREEASSVGLNGTILRSETGPLPTVDKDGLATAETIIITNIDFQGSGATTIHGHPTSIMEVGINVYPFDALTPTKGVDDKVFEGSFTNIIVGKIDKYSSDNVYKDQNGKIVDNRREGIAIFRNGRLSSPKVLTTKTVRNILNRNN